jgi:hypothetical protein
MHESHRNNNKTSLYYLSFKKSCWSRLESGMLDGRLRFRRLGFSQTLSADLVFEVSFNDSNMSFPPKGSKFTDYIHSVCWIHLLLALFGQAILAVFCAV